MLTALPGLAAGTTAAGLPDRRATASGPIRIGLDGERYDGLVAAPLSATLRPR